MSFIFIYIPLLLLFSDQTSVFAQIDKRYLNCSSTFDCGNITAIGYPFWASNRRPDYCGHPEFELNCSAQSAAMITIENLTYQVLEIDSLSKSLKIARADYLRDICSDYLANTTLDFTLFSYDLGIQNITLFYSCPNSSTSLTPTTVQNFTGQFSCDGGGGFYLTRNQGNMSTSSMELLGNCADQVVVPATQSAVGRLESGGLTEENLIGALGEGFGVQWHANNTVCETCVVSGGACGSNSATGSFACYCTDQPYPFSCSSGPADSPKNSGGGSGRELPGIGVAIGAAATLTICLACLYCRRRRRKRGRFCNGDLVKLMWRNKTENEKIEAFIMNYQSLMPHRYSYTDIQKITNSFVDKLGKGGFGDVYKGRLPNGQIVAVKVLNKSTGDNGEEFINEVASISRTSHINVVALLGFCYDGNHRAFIYEFMANGSLDKFIYDMGPEHHQHLDWKTLYNIAVGAARGLEYLHRGCNTRIVHFDIKPHNILLDEEFCPKISDFGLAKLYKGKESLMSSMLGARGTVGYIAPEVFVRSFGGVSYKSDVYSYGMMILEMFGGRKKTNVGESATSDLSFPDSIYKHLELRTTPLLDEHITTDEDEMVKKAMIVGFWCIQTNPSDRPSMTTVVQMLEGRVESLQVPPKPYLVPTTTPNGSAVSSTPSIIRERDEEKVLRIDA